MGIILVRHFTTNHVLIVAVDTHKHQIDVSPFASLKYTQPRDHRAVQSCSSHQFLRELRQPRESERRAVTRFYFSTPPTTREFHLSPFQFATPMSIRISSLWSKYQTPAPGSDSPAVQSISSLRHPVAIPQTTSRVFKSTSPHHSHAAKRRDSSTHHRRQAIEKRVNVVRSIPGLRRTEPEDRCEAHSTWII